MIDKYTSLAWKTRIKKLLPFLITDIAYTFLIVRMGYFPILGTGIFATFLFWSVPAFNLVILFCFLLGQGGIFTGFLVFFATFLMDFFPHSTIARTCILWGLVIIQQLYLKLAATKQWKRALHKYYPHLTDTQLSKITSTVKPLLKTSNYIVTDIFTYPSSCPVYELFILSQKLLLNHFLIASVGSGKTKQFGFLYVKDRTFSFFPFTTIDEMESQSALLLNRRTLGTSPPIASTVAQTEGILKPYPEKSTLQLHSAEEIFPFTLELPYFESDIDFFFSSANIPAQFKSTHIAKQSPFCIDDMVNNVVASM